MNTQQALLLTIVMTLSPILPLDANPTAAQAKITEKDFGKLSNDGVNAFDDIHSARLALFNGRPQMATKYVNDALASLRAAKSDSAVFTKAEASLHSPMSGVATGPSKSTAPVAWMPIDADVDYGETFEATPAKAAAVVNANKSLARGEGAKALETLREASVDVNYVLGVAPLAQSVSLVTQASQFMSQHNYYDAGEALRKAEAGIRYDEIDDVISVRGSKAR